MFAGLSAEMSRLFMPAMPASCRAMFTPLEMIRLLSARYARSLVFYTLFRRSLADALMPDGSFMMRPP